MSLFGDIGGLLKGLSNPFGLSSNGAWNLQKGKFVTADTNQEVTFFIEQKNGQYPGQYSAIDTINDNGGRRVAVYEYPYVDGQGLADLGRKGERFTMNIKFFGNNYQELFKQFLTVVEQSGEKGTLTHPVRGAFTCRFLDWEHIHRYDEWNAVTIKAVFIEDNTDEIGQLNTQVSSPNSLLRNALQTLASVQSTIQEGIATVGNLVALPTSILTGLQGQLLSVTSSFSALLGQLAATFSSDAQLQTLMANAEAAGSVLNLNTGTVEATPSTPQAQLPPVFQVGFSAADQANIENQLDAFVSGSQITTQQALFAANNVRSLISQAIASAEQNLGNDGFAIALQYRILANQVQSVTQGCIALAQSQVVQYTVPSPMSLRMVAYANGLSPDRQNDIESLNPYLGSVNYIPAGTIITVPAA